MKNKIFSINVPKSLRRSAWIRDHDFDPWFNVLTWATGISEADKLLLRILLKRIQSMYIQQGRRRNFRFVYSYLKECYTISTSRKVLSPYTPKMGVKVGSITGIPTIIPGRIRQRMLSDRRLYITTMTILGIHRIIPWWPATDLSSITDRFNGKYESLAFDLIIKAKRKLCVIARVSNYRILNLKASMIFPQSAGPNISTAYYGVFADTIGILLYPSYAYTLIRWLVGTRSWALLGWFSLQSLLSAAFILYSLTLLSIRSTLSWVRELLGVFLVYLRERIDPVTSWRGLWGRESFWDYGDVIVVYLVKGLIGLILLILPQLHANHKGLLESCVSRLATVYNTAGKARVIGITNYWVQAALYPLHREIFKFLRLLPTDGTFSQLSPIWALPKTGRQYHSFDLTAATDRLPRRVQKDVLSTFIGDKLSTLWAGLVDMPFKFEDKVINYSVGQPMGAYSSWAMLALTHHFIVQSYYSDSPERDYAILGDDVVVPEHLANHYQTVMESLGVSISLPKSIVSSEMVEFAKRVRTVDGEDLSIIGPGLIMAGVRDRWVSALALAEACKKGLQRWTNAPDLLRKTPGAKPGDSLFGCLVLFGPRPLIVDSQANVVLPQGKARAISDPANESKYVRSYMADFLLLEERAKYDTVIRNCHRSLDILKRRFIAHFNDCLGFSMFIPGVIKLLTLCLSPTTWYIIRESVTLLWLSESFEERYASLRGDSLLLIRHALAGREELIWGLDSIPTHQKVRSSRVFLTRFMDSFPWMEGLKPRVTIPLKGGSLDRAADYLEEAFPNLHRPIGPKIQLDTSGAPIARKNAVTAGASQRELTHRQAPSSPPKRTGGRHIFVDL